MSRARVHVGQAVLQGHFERYTSKFDLLEVRCDPVPPTRKFLRRLKQQAPEGFAFAVVAPRSVAELAATPAAEALAPVREAASELGARFIVLRTPASATPSSRTRARLKSVVEGLRGAAAKIAWEPRGIWSDEEIAALASELDVVAVRDLAEHEVPPGPVVYTRLLALGRNSRVGTSAIERVAERIADASEAYVIVEGQGAVGVAKRLRSELASQGEDFGADDSGALDDEEEEAESGEMELEATDGAETEDDGDDTDDEGDGDDTDDEGDGDDTDAEDDGDDTDDEDRA